MAFSAEFVEFVGGVKGEKSPPNRRVKLGRVKTQVAASRAFLRLVARQDRPPATSSGTLRVNDPALVVLDGSRSIGDAMGGDPTKGGLGMKRAEFSREFLLSRENAAIAVRCLLASGESEGGVAGLAGCETVAEFEELVAKLPTNEAVSVQLAALS